MRETTQPDVATLRDQPALRDLHRTDSGVALSVFRARPTDELFHQDREATAHLIVFPRSPVRIRFDDAEDDVVADPSVAIFYNAGDRYSREQLNTLGDRSDYLKLDPGALELAARAAGLPLDPDHPFPVKCANIAMKACLPQRLVFRRLLEGSIGDQLEIEEAAMGLLAEAVDALRSAQRLRSPARRQATRRDHERTVASVRALLATRYAEGLTLEEISDEVATSPFHLTRVFRAITGRTLHAHLTEVRLRMSLEMLEDGASDLTAVALSCGFSSHSHFSDVFRKRFGSAPSAVRSAFRGEDARGPADRAA